MGSHESFQDLIPLLALGLLPEAERNQIIKHLQECASCRKRYRQEQAVVKMLSRAVEPVEPSPDAKLKLFARVDADLAETRAQVRAAPKRAPTLPSARRAWFARPAFALAVLAVLALLAAGAWLVFQNLQSPEQRQIAAILSNPNKQKVTLKGTENAPAASADMYMVPGQSAAVLQVKGLKPLTPDQAYEFWFIRGKDPQPSNVFTVNPDGSFTLLVQANDTVEKFNAWGVSIEPRSGVSKPTGPIVMLGGG